MSLEETPVQSFVPTQPTASAYDWVRSSWPKLLGIVSLLASAIYFYRSGKLNWDELLGAISSFSWRPLALGLSVAFLQALFQGSRLWALLPDAQMRPWREVMQIFSMGQVVNICIPARAGDALKIASLAKSNSNNQAQPPAADAVLSATGSVFIADKVVDIGSLLLLVLVFSPMWLGELSFLKNSPIRPIHFIWVLPVIAVFLVFALRQELPRWFTDSLKLPRRLLSGASTLMSPRKLALGMLFGVGSWALEGFVVMVLGAPLGIHLAFADALWILIVLNMGIAIPISFANIGTFEAAMAFGASRFGVPLPQALALATAHHLIQISGVFSLALIFGIVKKAAPGRQKNMEFHVSAQDKTRATEYYQGVSSHYNQTVGKGPLRFLRQRERDALLELAHFHDPLKRSLIDVGCGGGYYALTAKEAGLHVCVVDISPGMVQALKDKVDEAYVSDLDSLSLPNRYDLVICAGVLDFVLDPGQAFSNLAALVNPGGSLVVQAPRTGWGGLLYRIEKKIFGFRVNLFSLKWFQEQGQRAGLEFEAIRYPLPSNQVILFRRRVKGPL